MTQGNSPNQQLQDWMSGALGQHLLQWEQEKTDAIVSNVFGYCALQIGLPSIDFLRANRMRTKLILTEDASQLSNQDAHLQYLSGSANQIPLESHSVDLILLPHTLETHGSQHEILREIDRVLVHDGRLLIIGLNPGSLWGLRNLWHRTPITPVSNARQIRVARLKDWLQLLSFEIDRGHFGMYTPATNKSRWLKRWAFMDRLGDRWWPSAGAAYILSARKRTLGMHLVGPALRRRRKAYRRSVVVPQQTFFK